MEEKISLTVPCLNHNKEHIDLLEYLVKKYLIKR